MSNSDELQNIENSHPTDLILTEKLDSNIDEVQNCFGYIDIGKCNLPENRLNHIVRAISKENPIENHPLAAYKVGPRLIELVFGSNAAREKAATDGLMILSTCIIIERPKPLTKNQAIYVYGLPLFESDDNLKSFLNGKLNLTLKSDVRNTTCPETKIWNGGRSIVVEMTPNTRIFPDI